MFIIIDILTQFPKLLVNDFWADFKIDLHADFQISSGFLIKLSIGIKLKKYEIVFLL